MPRFFKLLVLFLAAPLAAQGTRIVAPRAFTVGGDESNSARIGVYMGDNGIRDTLGVLVNSVVENGPAAKAGLKEGDRIQAIGGVNLRMTRDDAEDSALSGMMNRRLTRELDKLKPGDDVELHVWSGGAAKTVRLKTVAARDLNPAPVARNTEPLTNRMGERMSERAALGLNIGGSLSKRDTAGVFVMSVSPDGPAEKAGIVEGDRIAKINSMDLRVPKEDAGDADLSRARMRRFTQELAKVKAGDAVTLTVVSGGRQREVRVNAVKASELKGSDGESFFFGDGAFSFPGLNNMLPNFQVFPRSGGRSIQIPQLRDMPNGGTYFFRGDSNIDADVRAEIERAMEQVRQRLDGVRNQVERIRIPSANRITIRS